MFDKGILIHFPFFQIFSPFLINYFLFRNTVSFFLKFFLSISNFLISGNFLKSGISQIVMKYFSPRSTMSISHILDCSAIHIFVQLIFPSLSFSHRGGYSTMKDRLVNPKCCTYNHYRIYWFGRISWKSYRDQTNLSEYISKKKNYGKIVF